MRGIGLGVLVILVILVSAFWFLGLVDAARRPAREYGSAGRSKGRWILAILLFGLFDAIASLVMVRRELEPT